MRQTRTALLLFRTVAFGYHARMSSRSLHAVAMVRTACIAAASAFVVGTTIPLALFARYIADDFGFALALREYGFWRYPLEYYTTVNGRYTTVALEMVAVSAGRQAVPLVVAAGLMLLVLMATMAVRRVASLRVVVNGRPDQAALVLVVLAGLIDLAPALYQSLIWIPGLLSYGVPVALMLGSAALWPSDSEALRPWRWVWHPAAALVAAGCSETSAICQVAAFGAIVLGARGRSRQTALIALAASLIGLAIAAISPGNAVRRLLMADIGFDPQPLGTAAISMLHQLGPDLYGNALRCAPYLLMIAAVLAAPNEPGKESTKVDFRLLATAILVAVAVTSAVLLAGYWSLGTTPPARALFVSKSWVFGAAVMLVIAIRRFFRDSTLVQVALTAAVIVAILTGPLRHPQNRIGTLVNARAFATLSDEVDAFAHAHPGTRILVSLPRIYEGLEVVSRSDRGWTNIVMARYYDLESVQWRPIAQPASLAPAGADER